MTDKEILDELISQREWWEKAIKDCEKKMAEYKKSLAMTNGLINLIKNKIKD